MYNFRPTTPADWWGEGPIKVLGGRDLVGGGTWLGCTKDGKLAFLTNVLEPVSDHTARTRGDLPVRYLQVIAYANFVCCRAWIRTSMLKDNAVCRNCCVT
jgi:uncharacterized protein with NRDE domain